MAIQVRYGGVWQTITGAKAFVNGGWRSLVAMQVFKDGAWRLVGNFSAPPPAPGGGSSGGGGGGSIALSLSTTRLTHRGTNQTSQATGNVTVTPSGGLAPYTYSWGFVSNDGVATYFIGDPAAATTAIGATGLPSDTECDCSIHCTVTDSLGTTATSDAVSASFLNTSLP